VVLVASTPFWPTTAADWASVTGAAVVILAAIVGIQQLHQAVKTRHAQLLADLSRRWQEPTLEESRALAVLYGNRLREQLEAHLTARDPESDILLRSLDFYEDLAVLVKHRALSFRMVRDSLGALICEEWEAWAEAVHFLRTRHRDDQIYENFQRLAERMAKKVGRQLLPYPPLGEGGGGASLERGPG
jgi:hypothetical protein